MWKQATKPVLPGNLIFFKVVKVDNCEAYYLDFVALDLNHNISVLQV
jgi:hypothetical protein